MAASPASPVRILVVDDHADTARVCARVLRRAGYEASTANGVAPALALCASQPFDLLLADMELPDGDGPTLLHAVRRQCGGIRAAAVTGHGDARHRAAAASAGFDMYLLKPLTADDLLTAVRAMASQSSPPPYDPAGENGGTAPTA